MATSGGSSLFAGITSGLTSTYSILANASSNGVTLESIAKTRSNSAYANTLNPTFASYIQTNFSSLDADKDGILSAAELSNMTSKMTSMGLTAAQLTQLGAASGLSGETLNQVLEHFADIDTNGDGKVTSSEISAYKLTSAMENKKTEFRNKAASDMSVFYGDSDSSSANSSSLLSYKYMNANNSSGSSSTNSGS